MDRQLYVFGYPSDCGGSSTELWHLLKLWRRHGCTIALIPTWSVPTGWQAKTEAIGCRTLLMQRDDVALPDGSIVVALCNAPFLIASKRLRNCRLIYLPCMCYLNDPLESQVYRDDGPLDAYVFQSAYQHKALVGPLEAAGVPADRCRIIRGAFDPAEFPFRLRHRNDDPFCFGRVSRTDPRKFRPDWWIICERIKATLPGSVACRTMGWHRSTEQKCGQPPMWCEALPKSAEPVADFIRSLDCLVQLGDVPENWPRVGLEAMSAGVPVIADRRGGWLEMIDSGRTGLLVDSADEAVAAVARLAADEPFRMQVAEVARQAVVDMTDESIIWEHWQQLFASLN